MTSSKKPKKDRSSIESINDNEKESIEAVERDYDRRSSDDEDGAIPMDHADQASLPEDAARRPSRTPRNNI